MEASTYLTQSWIDGDDFGLTPESTADDVKKAATVIREETEEVELERLEEYLFTRIKLLRMEREEKARRTQNKPKFGQKEW